MAKAKVELKSFRKKAKKNGKGIHSKNSKPSKKYRGQGKCR
jgi:hypothetical protein